MAASKTLTSTTLEGQLLELIRHVQAYQGNATTNPDARTPISSPLTINAGTGIASVSLTLPVALGADTDGSVDTTAVEIFVDP